MAAEDMSIRKKLSTLYRDKKKDPLRASKRSARLHPLHTQGYKCINLSFENKVSGTPAREGPSMELAAQDSFHRAQLSRYSKAVTARVQGALLLLPLTTDISVVYMMLVLLPCKMQELWGQSGFHQDFKGKPESPGKEPERALHEAMVIKTKVQWRPQVSRDARNTECLPRKVAAKKGASL